MTAVLNLQARFQALTAFLLEYENLWRPVPFFLPVLPWESAHPALASALRTLDDKTLTELETDNAALVSWLTPMLPGVDGISALQRVPAQRANNCNYPRRFDRDIPGRKWQQITAFVGCLEPLDGRVLEWCAGKSHLGRALYQRFQTPVTGLEWNSGLCQQGNALSDRHNVDVRLEHCDVLTPAAAGHLSRADHAVALHACGDLHRRLIEAVSANGTQSLHLSPCCYHLSSGIAYRPFSNSGRASGLRLNRDDCRLAVQETMTAAAITTTRRHKKNAWRLGFDTLQRQLRAVNEYLPVPPIPDAALKGDFAAFCRQVAELKALALPEGIDWSWFEKIGWQRQSEVSRLELPRHAFRRVLELWLVLDRALYLEESGYRVAVYTFCERELTPRNLMISASNPQSQASPRSIFASTERTTRSTTPFIIKSGR